MREGGWEGDREREGGREGEKGRGGGERERTFGVMSPAQKKK